MDSITSAPTPAVTPNASWASTPPSSGPTTCAIDITTCRSDETRPGIPNTCPASTCSPPIAVLARTMPALSTIETSKNTW